MLEENSIKCTEQLRDFYAAQHSLDVTDFEEEIVYGLTFTALFEKQRVPIVVCLYPDEERFLLLVNKVTLKFEVAYLADLTIRTKSHELESVYKLNQNRYLVLKESSQWIIVFDTAEQCSLWKQKLSYLIQKTALVYRNSPLDTRSCKAFLRYNQNSGKYVNKKQLSKILESHDLKFDGSAHKILKELAPVNSKGLSREEFDLFFKTLLCKSELKLLFYKYCPEFDLGNMRAMVFNYLTPLMNIDILRLFLREEQFTQDSSQVERILKNFPQKISFYDFCNYIFCEENSIIDPLKLTQYQSTNFPLTHYYVHSSHNTYLSGNQLTSDSKSSRYIEDLYAGVRCLEIDIHDSWEGPIVKHGFTLTASISFESVIGQIAEFSLLNPQHTPIILSFENHCGAENQRKMAEILKAKLPDKIHTVPQNPNNKMQWPTLEQLKGKVIIQGTGQIFDIRPSLKRESLNTRVSTGRLSKVRVFKDNAVNYPEEFKRSRQIFRLWSESARSAKAISTTKLEKPIVELQQIILIQAEKSLLNFYSIVVGGLDLQQSCWEMGNLSEGTVLNMISNWQKHEQLVEFTKKCWVRVYPQGIRVQSSNYNPIPMYEAGAQLVSLNTQKADLYNTVMRGFFLENGNYEGGFVLKPEYMRTNAVQPTEKFDLRLRIISCHNLLSEVQESLNASVQVGFVGSRMDMSSNTNCEIQRVTEVRKSVNYQCIFREASEIVYTIEDVFFANVYFCIPGCGQISVPVRLMRQGYRVVPLVDDSKRLKPTYILVHVSLKPSKRI